MGLIKKKEAAKWDVELPLWTTILLYVQLALGTILFVFYMVDYTNGEIDLLKRSELRSRFWAVEHFILMVFTLVVSHIGWIFARNSKTPQLIFKKNVLYFGVACAMIMVSMAMNVIRHAL
jgi:magnesium-transporting ATPase (P-type)